jgi:hypothetical protein
LSFQCYLSDQDPEPIIAEDRFRYYEILYFFELYINGRHQIGAVGIEQSRIGFTSPSISTVQLFRPGSLKVLDLELIIGVVYMAHRPDRNDYFLIDGTLEDSDNSYLYEDRFQGREDAPEDETSDESFTEDDQDDFDDFF